MPPCLLALGFLWSPALSWVCGAGWQLIALALPRGAAVPRGLCECLSLGHSDEVSSSQPVCWLRGRELGAGTALPVPGECGERCQQVEQSDLYLLLTNVLPSFRL